MEHGLPKLYPGVWYWVLGFWIWIDVFSNLGLEPWVWYHGFGLLKLGSWIGPESESYCQRWGARCGMRGAMVCAMTFIFDHDLQVQYLQCLWFHWCCNPDGDKEWMAWLQLCYMIWKLQQSTEHITLTWQDTSERIISIVKLIKNPPT